jgi:hypothetical protein
MAVPDGWSYERIGTTICFRDPSNVRFLSIDPDRNPAGDPVQACQKEAARLVQAGELPKYTQIDLQRAPLQIKAADWEYTYDGPQGGGRHALTRWYAAGGKAYAVGWITREFDWNQNWIFYQLMRSTLKTVKPAKAAIVNR